MADETFINEIHLKTKGWPECRLKKLAARLERLIEEDMAGGEAELKTSSRK